MNARPTTWTPLVGAATALAAAALFGVSAPLAKLLLRQVDPLFLSGILYLGAGLGLSLLRLALPARGARETPLRRTDLGLLVGIVVMGGIVAPLLLLHGLAHVPAVAASLLLNLETPFTIAIAIVVFGEHLGRREALASLMIVSGVLALSYDPRAGGGLELLGTIAIAGACLSWAIDNNLTQRLSLRDPIAIVQAKALVAGTCSLGLALALGQQVPAPLTCSAALLLGFASYGLSLVLAVRAMRILGAARQAAFFATAPFVGAMAAVPLVGERLDLRALIAMAVMAAGVAVLLRENHDHEHVHDPLEHDHAHTHDEHHRHEHRPADPTGENHAHPHRHEPLVHRHGHVSDLHHRH